MFDISAAGTLSPQIRARFASKHAIQCRWRRRRQRPQLILMTSTGPRSERSGKESRVSRTWADLCFACKFDLRARVFQICVALESDIFFSSSSWETGANFALECLRLGGGSSQDSRRVERIKQRKKNRRMKTSFSWRLVFFARRNSRSLYVCATQSRLRSFPCVGGWMCDVVAGDQLGLHASVAFSKCESALFYIATTLTLFVWFFFVCSVSRCVYSLCMCAGGELCVVILLLF